MNNRIPLSKYETDNQPEQPELLKNNCGHLHKAYHVNQDCIELICEDCDKEIDFMCIGDMADDQYSLNIIYEIIKNKVNYIDTSLGLKLKPTTKCLLDLQMKYLELLQKYNKIKKL